MPRLSVKERCFDGYIKLLEEKDYNSISISDITKAAGISRTSFYRCFERFDLLEDYAATTIFEKLIGDFLPKFFYDKENMWRMTLKGVFTRMKDGTAVIAKIKPVNFPHIFEMVAKKFDQETLAQLSIKDRYSPVCDMAILFGVASAWAKAGFKEDIDELAEFALKRIMN